MNKKLKKQPLKAQDFLKLRLEKMNEILNRLEGEVESLVKRLVKQGERSSRELRKNLDEVLKRFKKIDLYTKAQETTEGFDRELRRLADEVVSKVKGLEIAPSGFTSKKLLRDARKNLNAFVNVFEKNDFLSRAKLKAENTRDEVLSFLKIPSQAEVEKLERKVVALEKRLQNFSQKAA